MCRRRRLLRFWRFLRDVRLREGDLSWEKFDVWEVEYPKDAPDAWIGSPLDQFCAVPVSNKVAMFLQSDPLFTRQHTDIEDVLQKLILATVARLMQGDATWAPHAASRAVVSYDIIRNAKYVDPDLRALNMRHTFGTLSPVAIIRDTLGGPAARVSEKVSAFVGGHVYTLCRDSSRNPIRALTVEFRKVWRRHAGGTYVLPARGLTVVREFDRFLFIFPGGPGATENRHLPSQCYGPRVQKLRNADLLRQELPRVLRGLPQRPLRALQLERIRTGVVQIECCSSEDSQAGDANVALEVMNNYAAFGVHRVID